MILKVALISFKVPPDKNPRVCMKVTYRHGNLGGPPPNATPLPESKALFIKGLLTTIIP